MLIPRCGGTTGLVLLTSGVLLGVCRAATIRACVQLKSWVDATLCRTGEEALLRLATETYDLILLDLDLPGMSGLDLCRQLKAGPQLQDIPVIFVSGQHSPENKQEAERLGAVEIIEKPVTLLRFLSRVMGQLKLKANGEREMRELLPVVTP